MINDSESAEWWSFVALKYAVLLWDTGASTSHDVWQFGIVIFVCLTGCLPWQKAATDDPRYVRYVSWQTSNIPLKRQPKLFKLVSSRAQRLFKKYLEPRPEKRPAGLGEVYRFMDDRWMSKVGMEKTNEVAIEEEGLCPSMYSFHSSPEEKNKLLFSLTQYGLETTVDRCAKKDRIREWIQTSVIEEVNEDEEAAEEDVRIIDNQAGPVGERMKDRGPISENKIANGQIHPIRKPKRLPIPPKEPAMYTPPIDPRIPLEKQLERKKVHFSNNPEQTTSSTTSLPITGGPVQLQSIIKHNSAYDLPKEFISQSEGSLMQSYSIKQQSSTSFVTHNINVQVPQSDTYSIPLSPKFKVKQNHKMVDVRNEMTMNNGFNVKASTNSNKKILIEDKKYTLFGSKSSSSNSGKS